MKNLHSKSQSRGFALVVALSLMILLTVIAVGLLTLSSVSLRSASQGGSMSVARANARMAMMLALGDLQKHTGADTRVTARADVLNASNPPVFGAWKSWEGTNHELTGGFAGRPVSPGSYEEKKRDRFLSWLVSGVNPGIPDTSFAKGKATLVGEGSVGSGVDRAKLQIHLSPSGIRTSASSAANSGFFAWWVGGENSKARLPNPYEPTADTAARWATHLKSHAVADTQPFRMDPLLDDPKPAAKAATLLSADLVAQAGDLKASKEFFHDLSAVSTGLLTNTATGGWRKDLSLLTEKWSAQPSGGLPLFRVKPGEDIQFSRANSNPLSSKSLFYPWSAYRGGGIPIYQHGAVTSWENLADFATMYRSGLSASASGRVTMNSRSFPIDDSANMGAFLHKVRVLPVIARIQWVFHHWAAPNAAAPTLLEPRLLVTPVVTMWNPYSVELASPSGFRFRVARPLPAALRYSINGATNTNYNCLMAGASNNQPALSSAVDLFYDIQSSFTLKPGETRVFSPGSTTPVAASTVLTLLPGYRSRGGHFFPVIGNDGKSPALPGSASLAADAKFDTTYNDGSSGVGIYLDLLTGGKRHLVYRMVYDTAMANTIYKPITNLAATTLGQCQTTPVPFLSTIFGARMASNTHIPAKGFLQSSPLVNYTAMGSKDLVEVNIARRYAGTSHPVNSPFDYSFVRHAAGDTYLPNADSSNRGYIVTGFQSSNGLSRCVVGEVPVRPLQSLAELQNWDLRYENPIPPFAINLIGNSSATPLLPSNAVVNSGDSALAVNLQHDDSYCANHLLFDDWFFSSIAPNPAAFGFSGAVDAELRRVFTAFVSGTEPLPNRSYKPINTDRAAAAAGGSGATQLFARFVNPPDSWRSIASRIEVEGMFNVNSTSVTAWRALLGHARGQKVPFIRESGAAWDAGLSGEVDYPVSRFPIAGDVEAGARGSSGIFREASEFAGYRTLNDSMLDALAEEIVNQVRQRGPFLSLAEFVNRQLASGDLALAGTIQAALDKLASASSNSPYAAITSYLTANGVPDAVPGPGMEYQFPAAAAGKSAFGLPGWIRQADVLRPIAPVLSARDDTFTIRAYGDARDAANRITATAVCEVVVRRSRDFVDPRDLAEATGQPVSPVNLAFGRRYEIVAFRWLSSGEI